MRITTDQWRALHDSKGKSLTGKARGKVASPTKRKAHTSITFDRFRGDGFACVIIRGLRLASEANARDHFMAVARRKASQAQIVAEAFRPIRSWVDAMRAPIDARITRHGPRRLDKDNLWRAAKGAIDQVAKILGYDDGDVAAVDWTVEPATGPYAVTIHVQERR